MDVDVQNMMFEARLKFKFVSYLMKQEQKNWAGVCKDVSHFLWLTHIYFS